MSLKLCSKAAIYDNDGDTILCQASVRDVDGNTATLVFDENDIEILESEMIITFYDDVLGLITYNCQLAAGKKFIDKDRKYKQALKCVLGEQLSVLQRRSDIKVHVDIPVRLLIPPTVELPPEFSEGEKHRGATIVVGTAFDLSAGGLFLHTLCDIPEESSFSILLPVSSDKAIELDVTMLRKVPPEENAENKNFGYGCKFVNMSSSTETTIRSFVFRQQMLNRKMR